MILPRVKRGNCKDCVNCVTLCKEKINLLLDLFFRYNTHMHKNTHSLAGNFETLQDAEIAVSMIVTFAAMRGCSEPVFKIEKIAENFYRVLQKTVKLPK